MRSRLFGLTHALWREAPISALTVVSVWFFVPSDFDVVKAFFGDPIGLGDIVAHADVMEHDAYCHL